MKTNLRRSGALYLVVALALHVSLGAQEAQPAPQEGSVIFVHPDGAGVSAWSAARLLLAGPDGTINWDRLERLGVYRGHMKNAMGATSHGGATSHAYGVKVEWDSYGMDGRRPLLSLSGKPYSILTEAHEAGLATALVNSGHLAEPGTGVFAASAPGREVVDSITLQILESGTDFILAGGEVLLLPEDVVGRHGYSGFRKDGRNLIELAEERGYEVVYTGDELAALPSDTKKVLGVFSAAHTFNDWAEEALETEGLHLYHPTAPSVGEMTEAVLRFLEASGRRFLLVVEEEGSDNFANNNNAKGALAALARADEAIGVALDYVDRNPETLVITTADSEAGGLQVYPLKDPDPNVAERPLPETTRNGGPLDGRNGTGSLPFMSKPDRAGREWPFGIAWASFDDLLGGIVVRAHGLNSEMLPTSADNTDIYRMMYATLFGVWLGTEGEGEG
jgi:alkaline phosphatase